MFKSFAELRINNSSSAKAFYGIAALVFFVTSIIICNSIFSTYEYETNSSVVENYSSNLSYIQEDEYQEDYSEDPRMARINKQIFEKDKQSRIKDLQEQYAKSKPFVEKQNRKAYVILITGLILAFIFAYVFVILARRDKKIKDERDVKEREVALAHKKAIQEEWKKKREAMEKQEQEEESKLFNEVGHGRPIKSARIYSDYSCKGLHYLDNKICVFSDDYLSIKGKLYKFTDILNYDAIDDITTKETSYTLSNGTSKSSNGNMALRSGVGYALAGPAGAIIGGTTSKKNNITHETTETTSETSHHYEIVIVVNDFKAPQINLDFKHDKDSFFEVKSILTIILNKNRSLNNQ